MTEGQEHIGAIIEIKYLGSEAIDRYLRDLERIGRITASEAGSIRQLWTATTSGALSARDAVLQLGQALNLTANARSGIAQIAADAANGERRVDAFTRSIREMNRAIEQSRSGVNLGAQDPRAAFAGVVASQIGRGTSGIPPSADLAAIMGRQNATTERLIRTISASTQSQLQIESRQAADQRRLIEAINRQIRMQDRAAEVAYATGRNLEFAPSGAITGFTPSVSESPAIAQYAAIQAQITALNREFKEVARSGGGTRADLVYQVQQSNAALINDLVQRSGQRGTTSGLLGADYNGFLQDIAAYVGGRPVRSGEQHYQLLTHGRVTPGDLDKMGPDAARLIGIDPQARGRGERYVTSSELDAVTRYAAYGGAQPAPLSTEASARVSEIGRSLGELERQLTQTALAVGPGVRGLIERPTSGYTLPTAAQIQAAAGVTDPGLARVARQRMLAGLEGATYPTGGTSITAPLIAGMQAMMVRAAAQAGQTYPRPPEVDWSKAQEMRLPLLSHGSVAGLPSQLLPADQVPVHHGQLFGRGFYAIDPNESPAARSFGGGYGHETYQVDPGRQRLLDLDKIMPPAQIQGFIDHFQGMFERVTAEIEAGNVPTSGRSGTGPMHSLAQAAYNIAQNLRERQEPRNEYRDPEDFSKITGVRGPSPLSYATMLNQIIGANMSHEATAAATKLIQQQTGATAFRATRMENVSEYVLLHPEQLRVVGQAVIQGLNTRMLPQYGVGARPVPTEQIQGLLSQYSGAAIDRGQLGFGLSSAAGSARIAALRQSMQQAEQRALELEAFYARAARENRVRLYGRGAGFGLLTEPGGRGFLEHLQAPTITGQPFLASTGGVLGRYSPSQAIGPYMAGFTGEFGVGRAMPNTGPVKQAEAEASARAATELEQLARAADEASLAVRRLERGTPGLAGASQFIQAGASLRDVQQTGPMFSRITQGGLDEYAAAQAHAAAAQQAFTAAQAQAATSLASGTRNVTAASQAMAHVPGFGTASGGYGAYPRGAGYGPSGSSYQSFGYPWNGPPPPPPGQGGPFYGPTPPPPYGQYGPTPAAAGGAGGGTGTPPPPPPAGGFFASFGKGFRGNEAVPVAEQLGQTARFSVYYGLMYKALFALTQTFQAAVNEAIEFQQATTELKLATGRSGDVVNKMADDFGQIAAQGGFAPAEGVTAAARAIGLYGYTDASAAQQRAAGAISARTTTQLALGSGQPFQQIQAQTAAIANAYGLGVQGQGYVGDLDAYLTRRFGVAPGSTLQPVSETAALGKAAGFSLEEQTAIAAEVQARLGVDAGTAGGLLSQIFSRTGGDFAQIGGRFGVDTSGSLKQVLGGLSAYSRAHPEDQTDIASSFGRGRSQGLAQVLLQDLPTILARAQDARADASGSLQSQYEQRLNNLGGQLAILGGQFKEFALLLGNTGLIDAMALLIKGLQGLFGSVNGVLALFDSMPRVLRDVVAGLIALAVATKVPIFGSILGATLGRTGIGTAASSAYGATLAARMGSSGVITGLGATTAGATFGARGAAFASGGLAAGAALLTNPITYAVGGLLAVGSLYSSATRLKQAMTDAALVQDQFFIDNPIAMGVTGAQYASQASVLGTQATAIRDAPGFVGNALSFGAFGRKADQEADVLDAQRKYFNKLANEPFLNRPPPPTAFTWDPESIDEAFTTISNSGGTAITQLHLLERAIDKLGGKAEEKAAGFRRRQFAEVQAPFLSESVQHLRGLGDTLVGQPSGGGSPITVYREDVENELRKFGDENTRKLFKGALDKAKITSPNQLKGKKLTGVTEDITDQLAAVAIEPWKEYLDPKQEANIADNVRRKVRLFLKRRRDEYNVSHPADTLSPEDANTAIDKLYDTTQARLGDLGERDTYHRLATLRGAIAGGRRIQAASPDALPDLTLKVNKLRVQYAETKIQQIDDIRRLAQHNADNDKQVRAYGRRAIRAALEVAINQGDTEGMIKILEDSGDWAVRIALQFIQATLKLVRTARREYEAMVAATQSAPGAGAAGIDVTEHGGRPGVILSPEEKSALDQYPGLRRGAKHVTSAAPGESVRQTGSDAHLGEQLASDVADRATKEQLAAAAQTAAAARSGSSIEAARAAVASAAADLHTTKRGSTAYYQALGALYDAQNALADTLRGAAGARITAEAARQGGQLAGARAAVTVAGMELQDAVPGTAEYYQALGSYYQAQIALSDTIRDYQHVIHSLAIDTTNPLLVANLASREAQQKLAQDLRAGRGPDVIAQDRLDVRNAQTEAEQTRFQQRLDRAQTADNLGRISHQAYIRYLDHEKDRLESIKNRTFQQQQQLDQIDGLLKDAADSMGGQFNLGTIDLPTPYEVRRFVQQSAHGAQAAAAAGGAQASTSVTTINVDGTDVAMVRRIIREVTGTEVPRRTGTARRKTTVR